MEAEHAVVDPGLNVMDAAPAPVLTRPGDPSWTNAHPRQSVCHPPLPLKTGTAIRTAAG